ncbi:MAG: hypothetical protein M3454_05795 [Actinomycetota bacterium]|nr:hypothetical protein [Actinomycetota bacterium]
MIEELRLFARIALYAAPAAAIYWLVSSEVSGTWMLAALVGAVATWVAVATALTGRPTRPASAAGLIGFEETEKETEHSSLEFASQVLPGRSAWPAAAALAAFVTGLGAVYGGWFAVPGLLLGATCAVGWLLQLER